jgi:ActR/RegA family two-component response regulator
MPDEKILIIDDDPNLLSGCRRMLRKEFDVTTAEGGREGIECLRSDETYAVVVADMRMPEVDGLAVLHAARRLSPDSVRVMLTGNADQATAVNAVNEGNVFRFLTKPCDQDTLKATLRAAIRQYQLVVAEKQLLEDTLRGSLKVMADLLSACRPKAFSRGGRIQRYVRRIASALGLQNSCSNWPACCLRSAALRCRSHCWRKSGPARSSPKPNSGSSANRPRSAVG